MTYEYREPGSTVTCANPNCQKRFVLNAPNQRYCSLSCALKVQRRKRRLRSHGLAPLSHPDPHATPVHSYSAELEAEEAAAEENAKLNDQSVSAIRALTGFAPRNETLIVKDTGATQFDEDKAAGPRLRAEIMTKEQVAEARRKQEEERLIKLDKEHRAELRRKRAIARAKLLEGNDGEPDV